jgi:hypothetical protein
MALPSSHPIVKGALYKATLPKIILKKQMRKIVFVFVLSNKGGDRVCIYFYSAVYTE